MTDLLEEFAEAWRAAQPPPPVIDPSALTDRRRLPVVALAVVLLLVAAAGVGVAVDRAGTHPAPASIGPAGSASPTSTRHAGTLADPVPWSAQPVGEGDVPVQQPGPIVSTGGGVTRQCPPLTGTLVVTGTSGRLTLRATTPCGLESAFATVTVDGVTTLQQYDTSGGHDRSQADYGRPYLGPASVAVAELAVPSCLAPTDTATVAADGAAGTVTVTGLHGPGCAERPSITPLGTGYAPGVAPPGRQQLQVSLRLPATGSVGTPVDGTLTLANPTAVAQPLAPCPGLGLSLEHGSGRAGTSYQGYQFRLACDQAPEQVPAHGSVVFAVEIPTASQQTGALTVHAAIVGPAEATATVTLASAAGVAACGAYDLVGWVDAERPDGAAATYELALTNTTAKPCRLTGRSTALVGELADGTRKALQVTDASGSGTTSDALAPPGLPIHVLLDAQPCTGPAVTTLDVAVADGSVEVSTATLPGGLPIACGVALGDFYGPVSALTGHAPNPFPALVDKPCLPEDATFTGATKVADGFAIGVEAKAYPCFLWTERITSTATTGVSDADTPGVEVQPGTVAHVLFHVPYPDCPALTNRTVTDLGLVIEGEKVDVAIPGGSFKECPGAYLGLSKD